MPQLDLAEQGSIIKILNTNYIEQPSIVNISKLGKPIEPKSQENSLKAKMNLKAKNNFKNNL